METTSELDNPLTFSIGHEQLVIRRRYETLSIFNDFRYTGGKDYVALICALGSCVAQSMAAFTYCLKGSLPND